MSSKVLISLIIPIYNEERYLDSCLSSLTNQTYQPLEIICIDDGSTDHSRKITRKYPVKLLHQSHQGPDAARNLGAKKALGQILVFPDADMSFDRNYVKYLTESIISGKNIGTFVINEMVANPENIWSRCWNINSSLPPNRRLPVDHPPTSNVFRAIKKEVFLHGGGLMANGYYNDDSTFSRKNNILAVAAPKAICYHHNPESLREVYFSTRWMGRSPLFPPTFTNFLRYTPLNSLRVSLKYLWRGAPLAIIPFKIIYDFGTLVGILFSGKRTSK